jgi:hypothetical protein
MSTFRIKRGDLLPEIEGTCEDDDGPVDLTNATSVRFLMGVNGSSTNKVAAAATFVSKPDGTVKYTWAGTDTDTVGPYDGEFEVTWPGSKPETFPNRGFIKIDVFQDRG